MDTIADTIESRANKELDKMREARKGTYER